MRGLVIGGLCLLLGSGCGGDDGDGGQRPRDAGVDAAPADAGAECGGFGGIPCEADLVCCHPDPRIADGLGMCVAESNLRALDQPCGTTSGACCAAGLVCDIEGDATDGVCRPTAR